MVPANSKLVALGASAGGIDAIQNILSGLTAELKVPLVIVQHLPANFSLDQSMLFNKHTNFPICEAADKMEVLAGNIYFAPVGYHLLLEKEGVFSLCDDSEVNFSKPSIDVFFESVANVYNKNAIGVLLTGANADGAKGLLAIDQCGGVTVVQDPASAAAPTMPQSALNLFTPSFRGDLNQIAKYLDEICGSCT